MLLRYRFSLGFFIFGLVISGLTTYPLRLEIALLRHLTGQSSTADYQQLSGLPQWIGFVETGLREISTRFPFFRYATDWLGFGHFVIAAFFILPFVNPTRYRAVLHIGLAACAGVILVALTCGAIRGIPFGWQMIDCSFGILGAIPLLYCLRLSKPDGG